MNSKTILLFAAACAALFSAAKDADGGDADVAAVTETQPADHPGVPPAWIVSSTGTVARAEGGDADAMVEIAQGYLALAFSPNLKLDDKQREAMQNEAQTWLHRRAKTMADREGDLESVRKRAEAGDAAAQRNLGFRYSLGVDVEKDEELAFQWTKKAAEQGDARAMLNLASDYAGGRSVVEADPAAATEWYRKALPGFRKMLERGEPMDARPLHFAGQLLLSGEFLASRVVPDENLGMEYVRLAAEAGDPEARERIDRIDFLRQQKEAIKRIDEIEAAAKAGDSDAKRRKARIDAWTEKGKAIRAAAEAEGREPTEEETKRMLFFWSTMPAVEAGYQPWFFEAGREFALGEIVPRDMAEASKWFREAANRGHAVAAFFLGFGYLKGIGVEKDDWRGLGLLAQSANAGIPEARSFLETLAESHLDDAERGDPSAQFFLAAAFENGYGVKRDFEKAVAWYRKAAEQGHPGAQAFLGWALLNGQGVGTNAAEAVVWFRKSAEQGNPEAQQNYGRCLFYGEGVEKDERAAVEWYRKASEQGEASAMYNLGLCHLNGTGTERNESEAIKWFRKSAELGHPGSAGILERLDRKQKK